MRRIFPIAAALAAAASCGAQAPAQAAETSYFSYDSRGRLLLVSRQGTVNNGVVTQYTIDKADNLTEKRVTTANQPPTTVTDNATIAICASRRINVVANDSDPEGNLPLSLVSVTGGAKGEASVASSTEVLYFHTGAGGNDQVTYRVQDSLGNEANGTLILTMSGPCNAG